MSKGLFSINRICKLCGIAKITYSINKHLNERFETKYSHIRNVIDKIIKGNSAYGIKRIKSALKTDYKIHIGRDALGRLLKLWGLQLKRKIKKAKISLIKKILISLSDRANILIRTKIVAPFQAITSDISEIHYCNGKKKAYFAVHKDAFGQMVYGWDLKETMDFGLIKKSFEKALKSIKKLIGKIPEKLLCHSDQGSQYTSYEYVDMALKNNMRLSYSTPGTPTDNPGQESFFGRLKNECQDEFNEIANFKELYKLINKRMNYYNYKRIHTSINYQSPSRFTKNFIYNLSLTQGKNWFSFFRT